MKNLLIASLILAGSTTAYAGGAGSTAPEAVAIEEPAMMGAAGSWLIPLVIVAIMGLALSNNNCKKRRAQEVAVKC